MIVGDDWGLLTKDTAYFRAGIDKGRWMRGLMRSIYNRAFPMPSVTLTLALLGILISARIQATIIGIKTRSSVFIYTAIFMLYPIWTEPLIFNLLRGTIFVSLIFIAISTYLIIPIYESFQEQRYTKTVVLLILSALLFSFSASGGQNIVLIGAETFLFALLVQLIRSRKQNAPPFNMWAGQFLTFGAVVLLGLAFYALEFMFSLSFFRIEETSTVYSTTGTLVSSWADLLSSAQFAWKILVQYLFIEQPFLPAFTKYISLFF